MAVRLEAPLEEPLGLVLLAGDEPDDVLGEAGGDGLRLDVRDEAVLVLALGQVVQEGVAHAGLRCAGSAEVDAAVKRGERGRVMSARVSPSREARIASLMICQFGFVEQKLSWSQRTAPPHSVIETGPSSVAMIEATVISRGRAREGVAAARPALGDEEAAVRELLEELPDGGEGQPRLVRELARRERVPVLVRRDLRQQEDPVVGHLGHSEHRGLPGSSTPGDIEPNRYDMK